MGFTRIVLFYCTIRHHVPAKRANRFVFVCEVGKSQSQEQSAQRKARAEGQTAQPLTSVGRRCGRYATVGRLGIRLRFGFFQRVDEQRLKSLLFQIY